jgi:spoIIIJ-associated protein
MEKDKISQIVKETLTKLLSLLEVDVQPEIKISEENEELVVTINIPETQEAGLLIGTRGSTLHAIQSFLALAIKQQTDQWVRVVLDIGDWRAKHEDYLKNLATQAAERARSTGQDQHLYNLTPSQRRTIHLFLSQEKGVVTESQGEGASRYLIVKAE